MQLNIETILYILNVIMGLFRKVVGFAGGSFDF